MNHEITENLVIGDWLGGAVMTGWTEADKRRWLEIGRRNGWLASEPVPRPMEEADTQPFSVRAAMREAGVPDWEMGKGVSSADAIRYLANQRDEARAALNTQRKLTDAAQAEVQHLRSRVRVEAEDVERRKVNDGRAKRYLLAHGFTLGHSYRGEGPDRAPLDLVQLEWGNDAIVALADHDDETCRGESIAFAVCWIGRKDSRSPWDILDEMAAMSTEAG